MQTKLTLRLEDNIIDFAKHNAMKLNMSLSKFTEMLYLKYTNYENNNTLNKSTITEKYSGIIKNKNIDEDNVIYEYLLEKHK